jgi:hypothetical protein
MSKVSSKQSFSVNQFHLLLLQLDREMLDITGRTHYEPRKLSGRYVEVFQAGRCDLLQIRGKTINSLPFKLQS